MQHDQITLLKARDGKRLCKWFFGQPDGSIRKRNYDNAFLFDCVDTPVHNIVDLHELLIALEDAHDFCAVRGELIEGRDPIRVVRRIRDHRDGHPPCFKEREDGHHWVYIDFDGVPFDGMHPDELDIGAEYLIASLPIEFQDASYHLQWSSSYGIGRWDRLSAHIWFWLETSWTDTELLNWAADTQQHLDSAAFRTVQPIYTARPIFSNMPDPLGKRRSTLVRKEHDTVSLAPYQRPVVAYRQTRGLHTPGARKIYRSFEDRLSEIGDHAGGFHQPVRDSIASYVRLNGSRTDRDELKRIIRERINSAPNIKGRNLIDYLNDHYLDSSIDGAIRKFGADAEAAHYIANYYFTKGGSKWNRKLRKKQ